MIGKNCIICNKPIKPKGNTRHQKYCSLRCRNKFYYSKHDSARWQKDNLQRKLLEKYDINELTQCKICGRYFRQVGSHVVQTHKYELARKYREEYGFDVKRGQLPPDYRELKAKQAIECGGAKNLVKGKKYYFKKGDTTISRYKRSKQTLERLRNLHKFNKI